jgi:hypothetical protein
MPTPAKLVCAVLFAALAWWTGEVIRREVLPEGAGVGALREALALGGLVIGWRYVGRIATGRTGRGTTWSEGVAAGIGGAILLAALALLVNGAREVLSDALGLAFTEVGEAAAEWLTIVYHDFLRLAHPDVLATYFGGAAAIGLVGTAVGRRLR